MASERQRNKRGQGGLLRQEILDAAHALLVETGAEGAITIRGVARKAGIAPQSCYLQFATRDDLLWALYGREFERLRAVLEAAADDGQAPLDRLRARARAYCAFAEAEPGAYDLLFGARGVAEHDWDDLPGKATVELWAATVAACLDDGRDAYMIATDLWAALHGSVTLRRNRPAFAWPGRQEDSIDRFIRALVAPDPR